MHILGISCFYHDAAAALLTDGVIVAAVEEERLSRKKHDASFPIQAIEYCLKSQKLDIDDITAICFYEKPHLKFSRILDDFRKNPPNFGDFSKVIQDWVGDDTSRLGSWVYEGTPHKLLRYKDLFWGKLYIETMIRKVLNFSGKIYFSTHHLSHAASSFYASPFDRSAVLTIDGVGEHATMTCGFGDGDKLSIHKQINYPDSIGLFYSVLTAYLGFSVNNSEYKVMGLSAYGEKNKQRNPFYKKLRSLVEIRSDGSFNFYKKHFDFSSIRKMFHSSFEHFMGFPARKPADEVSQTHMDIAAALQLVTEEIVFAIMTNLANETGVKNLCYAGGVALNSVANGKVFAETPFEKLYVQPASGDGGSSVGAAYVAYHHILGEKRAEPLKSVYLGPCFTDQQIKFYLDLNGIKYRHILDQNELIKEVASSLADNKIVGWFQGRMEWGPRALGARSILANPGEASMQDIINVKVKHREEFRPFAPVVCKDDAGLFFELPNNNTDATDYMLMVYPVKEEYRKKIPAVTHVDGSARMQTVLESQNEKYYRLIKEFGRQTGLPMLINTSFNIRGEPIVCTPNDAYKCFTGTAIDVLVMGGFIVLRDENKQDWWDSEALAND